MTDSRDTFHKESFDSTTIGTLTLMGAQERQVWALEKIHRTYHHRIMIWCREKGLNSTDIEDVCQTVFLKLLTGLHRFARNGKTKSLGAWLRCIAQRKSIDIHRDRKRTKLEYWPANELAQTTHAKEDNCISPTAEKIDFSQKVKDAMEIVKCECEPQTWKAFEEVVINGRLPVDIAHQLGISQNSVYLAKSRTIRRLRELLA